MGKLCEFISALKAVTWRRSTLLIFLTPLVLLFLIFNIILDLAAFMPAAVVSSSKICVDIGKSVLEEEGSAVDAAIATLVCEGVVIPSHTGIGGGFAATLFVRGKYDTIIATPAIPSEVHSLVESNSTYEKGPKTIGVPGELLGYWEMHKKYGTLPWKRLFKPSIDLATNGINVSQHLAQEIIYNAPRLALNPRGNETFPKLNYYKEGDLIKYPVLASTLKIIANEGVSVFYNGLLGRKFVRDIVENGGIMKRSDLSSYKVSWNDAPPSTRFRGHRLVTTPLPTYGPLLVLVINIIKSLDYRDNMPMFWHKMLQAIRFSLRLSGRLSDADNDENYESYILKSDSNFLSQDFAKHVRSLISKENRFPEAHYNVQQEMTKGALNVCVLGTQSDAVVVTTALTFGSSFLSRSTGIVANDILTLYLKKNKITPQNRHFVEKRIFTPQSPTIVVHKTKARPFFIVGATGGPNAFTKTVTALARYILFGESVHDAVNNNLGETHILPNLVELSDSEDNNFDRFTAKLGHILIQKPIVFDNFSTLSCIGNRYEIPELQSNDKVGEKSEVFFPNHGFNYNLVITTAAMLIIIIAILFYEVHAPINELIILKNPQVL